MGWFMRIRRECAELKVPEVEEVMEERKKMEMAALEGTRSF